MSSDKTPHAPGTGRTRQPTSRNRSSSVSRASNIQHSPSATAIPRRVLPSHMDETTPPRQSTNPVKVQRWAGLTRSVIDDWDNLRKDPELWSQDGDCYVHLNAPGASRRGPSFCVPMRALAQKKCDAMLNFCYAQRTSHTQASSTMSSFNDRNRGSDLVDLYIPGPDNASREECFNWHLTTRNFFAYVLGKPLVGLHMGQAFVDLQERMRLFRTEHVNNQQDFLDYAEIQGYRDLVECTDYALASLYYAEHYRLRDVWVDAFAHAVGMNDSIALSPEYLPVSRLTKALITRAHLEVDAHLASVAKALRTFLQDDFSPAYLGLADGARNHLDRFRRFLHHYYVEKFGYWPPPKSASRFPKDLYKSLFFDFKELYDYLVDTESTTDLSSQRPASGGICPLQVLDSFDKRHKFTAQAHPLPLLPTNASPAGKTDLQRLSRSSSSASQYKRSVTSAVLMAATNYPGGKATDSKIVQAYIHFENSHGTSSSQRETKVTVVDARKVRWLLIYGTLQYLTSALRAPKEVRDTDTADYPLCCLVAGQSTWNAATPMTTPLVTPLATPSIHAPQMTDGYFGTAQSSPFSIEPDCQRDDYFTPRTTSRPSSVEIPAPLKITLPVRQLSKRAFAPLSSLSTRSSRRNSLAMKSSPHCPILVRGYGTGLNLNETTTGMATTTQSEGTHDSCGSSKTDALQDTNTELSWLRPETPPTSVSEVNVIPDIRRNRTPLLQSTQLDHVVQLAGFDEPADSMSRSDSTSSTGSSIWTDGGSATSSESSLDSDRVHKARAEYSGLLRGLDSVDTSLVHEKSGVTASAVCLSQSDVHPLLRTPSPPEFQFDFDTPTADTYTFDSIGVAISAPPSSPAHLPYIPQATPAMADWFHHASSATAETHFQHSPAPSSEMSTDIFAGFSKTSVDVRLRYDTAMKRLEASNTSTIQYGDLCNSSTSSPTPDSYPPPITKTSHAHKSPSLRNRIWHQDGKTERRLCSLWRR